MNSSALLVVLALLMGQLVSTSLIGQHQKSQSPEAPTQGRASEEVKKVGFRLAGWKTIHSKDQNEATSDISTLKKIGCEVVTSDHGNHVDVRYQCAKWKSMELPSGQLASQWTSWLAAKGLETVVVDPPANTSRPTVSYRLVTPRTVHLREADQVEEFMGTLRLLNASVSQNNHGNHIDATYSCQQWQTIELPTEQKAHEWQNWLQKAGFETNHTH